MSSIFPKFFQGNEFFIDEKVNFFKFENAYKVYDGQGFEIGGIVQKLSGGQKLLRLLLKKQMLPFTLEIKDAYGDVQATIHRGWTFWLSKITVTDNYGSVVGVIKQKFSFLKPRFIITEETGTPIAEIKGDWTAWNFTISDPDGNAIGYINKKWSGAAREIFTSADKYNVSILPEVKEDSRKIAIVSTAITIDMVLKENNS